MRDKSFNKSELIAVRVTPKERKLIESNAAQNDLSLSNYIRAVAIHTKEIKTDIKQEKMENSIFDVEEYLT